MRLDDNRNLILNMVKEKEEIGKTAVMKYTFFLQRIFGLKLGYSFDIYTYGPYSSDVSGDLDSLIFYGFVDAEIYSYNKSSAYKLKITEKGEKIRAELSPDEKQKLHQVLCLFGDKKVRNLELVSTILYFADLYERIGQEDSEGYSIIKNVKEIKPHFDLVEIEGEFENLRKLNKNNLFGRDFIALQGVFERKL